MISMLTLFISSTKTSNPPPQRRGRKRRIRGQEVLDQGQSENGNDVGEVDNV